MEVYAAGFARGVSCSISLSLFFFSPLKGAPELKSLLVGVGQKVQKLCNIKLKPRQF